MFVPFSQLRDSRNRAISVASLAGGCLPKIVASTQEEIRRLARDGNALQPEAASLISSSLSIVGKIIGHGALTIFGHVEGEVRASTIVIAEGAQIEGKVSAEELTIGGYVKGAIHGNRVKLNSTAVVEGDIVHRTLMIEGSDASMKKARAIVRWNV
jgi:cytoskeletal protein CcmA (bactofilin family)